ncbi:transient receptor potential cation channel subfamily A member 1 homolog [Haliotis rubra]|uniref:transient receptor potential cation channel subfamily A member 1 homolog n=1 Tax=Haliotis rubra TaxID=36100 RepID=UPI001EE56A4C|nr:transient receptor potential cation channel subfamily A member 1 homolog [Haliotis rubra]
MLSDVSSSTSDESDEEVKDKSRKPTPPPGPDIHKLARQGDMEGLMDAFKEGLGRNVDEKDEKGFTPLQYAVMYNHVKVVNYLINTRSGEEAADHLIQDQYGLSLAHYAAKSVRGTTRNAPGVRESDSDQNSSVSSDDRQTCLELLIERDSRQGADEMELIYMPEHEHKQTPLHFAVMSGSIDSVHTLIDKGKVKLINKKDNHGMTPIHVAATYRQVDIMKYLIEEGAEVDDQDKVDESTPLHYACSTGTGAGVEMVDLLLQRENSKKMMETKDAGGNTCLHIATENGHEEIIQKLLANGADVSVDRNDGMYPLHLAVISGNLKIVKAFLTNTKKSSFENKAQSTPLHLAAQYNHLEIAEYLLEELQDLVTKQDNDNNTPLHIAALYNHSRIVKLLMENGGEIDAKNLKGRIPLHGAAKMGHIESLDVLLDPGVLAKGKKFMRMKKQNRDTIAQKLQYVVEQGSNYEDSKARGVIEEIIGKLEHEDKTVHDRIPSHRIFRIVQALKVARKPSHGETVDRPANSIRSSKVEPADIVVHRDSYQCTETKNNVKLTAAKKQHGPKARVNQVHAETDKDSKRDVDEFLKLIYTDNIINTEDNFGNTALHLAAQNGHTDFVQKMLEKHKVEHGRKNDAEKTALHLAAEHGHRQTVEVILKVDKHGLFKEEQWRNSPLHLAVKGGHTETAKLLIKNGADINQINEDKMTPLDLAAQHGELEICAILVKQESQSHSGVSPLHLACMKGHLKVVKLLLGKSADVTCRCGGMDTDKGLNCLDLAIKYGHKHVARYILNHKYWKEALRNSVTVKKGNRFSKKIVTPMRRLIRKMPDLAYEVLDRCVTTKIKKETGKDQEKGKEKTKGKAKGKAKGKEQEKGKDQGESKEQEKGKTRYSYNFEYIDDLYEDWAFREKKKKNSNGKDPEERKKDPYTNKASVIKKNHPLSIMVECNRDELLQHPLVSKLIKRKWWHFGAYYYLLNFIVHLIFVSMVTRYMLQSTHPRNFTETESQAINENICDKSISPALVVEKIILYVLMALGVVFEVLQMYNVRTAYLYDLENYAEWVAYICTFLLLLEFTDCTSNTGYRQPWQWSLGAFAVFFSWIDLVLYLKAFTSLGLYVVMFQLVCWTFLKVFVVFFSLILAFSLGFHILLQNQIPFRDVANSILKTSVMFIGEMDYSDIFHAGLTDATSTDTTNLLYPAATSVLFTTFLTLACIVLMNLLVGLAVDDIKGILRRAAFKQTALHIELVLDVEKVLNNKIRAKVYKKRNKIKQTKPFWPWKMLMDLPMWWWNQKVEKEDNSVLKSVDELTRQQKRLESLIVTMNNDMMVLLKQNDSDVHRTASVSNGQRRA